MFFDDSDRIHRLLLAAHGEWVDEPTIQRLFTDLYGSPIYKPAMDELRRVVKVEHRYFEGPPKKFWQYRIQHAEASER